MMDDRLISLNAALDTLNGIKITKGANWYEYYQKALTAVGELPSAQPEIIRCKDCRWWDKYGDYDNGYCMAAKHGYWSEHWEISIRRTYKGNFYCADAERRTE